MYQLEIRNFNFHLHHLTNFKYQSISISSVFTRQNAFEKNLAKGMLIEQIIEVESRVPGSLVVHIPKTGYFHDKKKSSKANLRVNDLMLKMLQKAMYLDSLTRASHKI